MLVVALCGCDAVFRLDPLPDAAPDSQFEPLRDCPGYDLDFHPGSRYRLVGPGSAADLNADCMDDTDGRSHLGVPDTAAELAMIQLECDTRDGSIWFMGAVQAPDASAVDGNWIWITGEPVPIDRWADGEPNDYNVDELDHHEQVGSVWQRRARMLDIHGADLRDGLCECDGRPVDPLALEYINANL